MIIKAALHHFCNKSTVITQLVYKDLRNELVYDKGLGISVCMYVC